MRVPTAMLRDMKFMFRRVCTNFECPGVIAKASLSARCCSSLFLSSFPQKLTNENFLLHGSWFQQRHLSSPLSHLSVGDIIRYIIIGHVPTNESLQSPSLKRWRLIDYLLSNITRFPPAVQSAKMVRCKQANTAGGGKTAVGGKCSHTPLSLRFSKKALFFDWLAFEDERSIMDVEPAALLLEHQLTSNSTSPAEKYGLLEFLLLLVSEMLPQQKAQFQASAMRALAACESKHVVDGFFLLLQSTAVSWKCAYIGVSRRLPSFFRFSFSSSSLATVT